MGEGVRCGACERPNGVGADHERSTTARRPAASASRQPWEPDRQRHADGAMAVRGHRRRAALVLHRRRTPHRVADRCGHGPSQGDGMSVDVLTAARRSSAVDCANGRVDGDSENAESDAPTTVFRDPDLKYQRVSSKLDVASSSLVSRSIKPSSGRFEYEIGSSQAVDIPSPGRPQPLKMRVVVASLRWGEARGTRIA
jgi:hypothetical protein